MSDASHTGDNVLPGSQPGVQAEQAVRRLIALVGTWRRHVRGRRELALMSDRSLRDIGLTRYEAFQEIRKPFWRP
jgi:uncharacterized protein YjiS (DUF1127 family)